MHVSLVLDTSAVVAILTNESNAELLAQKLLKAKVRLLPTTCVAEAILVLSSKLAQNSEQLLTEFIQQFEISLVPFEASHLIWFAHAHSRFGKGRHPAALNFGDCFTYSIAKSLGIPVLAIGLDFPQTDLTLA